MTAQEHLAQYGVSMEQARAFIISNLDNLQHILDVCNQFGVTNQMLAEIYGGVTADDVEAYFSSNGLDSSTLDQSDTPDGGDTGGDAIQFLPDNLSGLLSLIALNENTGTLSNASLRSKVIPNTGEAEYQAAFDPNSYEGAEDGVFTAEELGLSEFENLPATWETVESLFYGTLINTLKAIDLQEATELSNFVTTNADALAASDPTVYDQYFALINSIFEDEATSPLYSDTLIETVAVTSAEFFVTLIGDNPDYSIISGIANSFIPA